MGQDGVILCGYHTVINIRNVSDISRFAPVVIRQCRELTKSAITMPVWYRRPNHLHQVAA